MRVPPTRTPPKKWGPIGLTTIGVGSQAAPTGVDTLRHPGGQRSTSCWVCKPREESKPDSVRGDHLSARPLGRTPHRADAPYPGLGEQRQRPCFGLQRGGLPFSLPRPPERLEALVSVALTTGYPAPACAGHPALRCLDFPLQLSLERSPFLPLGTRTLRASR